MTLEQVLTVVRAGETAEIDRLAQAGALDFLTEKKLRTALNEKIRNSTQIVVTQRITSAMNADCIFVMDQGRLIDAGQHDELLGRCRIYQEIYASQTGGGTK